jgi:hypothetical protein
VPCRAVPCRAVPCRAVPCRAVPCGEERRGEGGQGRQPSKPAKGKDALDSCLHLIANPNQTGVLRSSGALAVRLRPRGGICTASNGHESHWVHIRAFGRRLSWETEKSARAQGIRVQLPSHDDSGRSRSPHCKDALLGYLDGDAVGRQDFPGLARKAQLR